MRAPWIVGVLLALLALMAACADPEVGSNAGGTTSAFTTSPVLPFAPAASAPPTLGVTSRATPGAASRATPGAAPTATGTEPSPGEPEPEPLVAADLDTVTSCAKLHERVLVWLDTAAAHAGRVHPVSDMLSLLADGVTQGQEPAGLAPLEGRWFAAPYGGLGGDAAAARYDELGCSPDDEFPALLAWAGLPADTETSQANDVFVDRFLTRMDDDGAGGYVALAFLRRLTEGGELSDSRLMVALRDVARAMEAHRAEHGSYAGDLEVLRPYLDAPSIPEWDSPDDPVIIIARATADAYCVHGADIGSAVLESHDGVPRNRTWGTPSCPNTFPDIDDQE